MRTLAVKPAIETLKAWCAWKRARLERVPDIAFDEQSADAILERSADLAAVKACEDLISQVGTFRAERDRANGELRRLEAELTTVTKCGPVEYVSLSITPDAMNAGHGHVFARPDGVKARCGGTGACSECQADLARKDGRG